MRGLRHLGRLRVRLKLLKEKYRMNNLSTLLRKLLNEDSGQDLIEYALIAALIALATITAMKTLSNKIGSEFNTIGNSL
jgi:pilus assembly protein Flp/PilA